MAHKWICSCGQKNTCNCKDDKCVCTCKKCGKEISGNDDTKKKDEGGCSGCCGCSGKCW